MVVWFVTTFVEPITKCLARNLLLKVFLVAVTPACSISELEALILPGTGYYLDKMAGSHK